MRMVTTGIEKVWLFFLTAGRARDDDALSLKFHTDLYSLVYARGYRHLATTPEQKWSNAFSFTYNLQIGVSFTQGVQYYCGLKSREFSANAKVQAQGKGQHSTGWPVGVEDVRVFEHCRGPIGRGIVDHHLVTGGNGHTCNSFIFGYCRHLIAG